MKPIVKQVQRFRGLVLYPGDVVSHYFQLLGFDGRILATSRGDQSEQRRDADAKALAIQLGCSLGRARAKKDKEAKA